MRTADETEVKLLKQEVITDLFEKLYSEENTEFLYISRNVCK